jgi:H(+)-translocating pyrophosphatase
MWSSVPPLLIITVTIICCVYLAGPYGMSIAAVGMLSTLAITLATDAYGPVADNAGGIAEMDPDIPEYVRDRTDALDALGNTTAATGKGFAIGSAVLTAFSYMVAYAQNTNIDTIDLVADIMVIPGLLLGAMLPFWFSSMTMSAVGRAAMAIVEEVRRQFKEIDGLLEGRPGVEADHQRCVDISTRAALREMIYPALLPMVSVVVVGLLLGAKALAALIAGAIITSFMLAVTMANAGGAWDNAKKYVESKKTDEHVDHDLYKGSDPHKAAVVGDTIGGMQSV